SVTFSPVQPRYVPGESESRSPWMPSRWSEGVWPSGQEDSGDCHRVPSAHPRARASQDDAWRLDLSAIIWECVPDFTSTDRIREKWRSASGMKPYMRRWTVQSTEPFAWRAQS